MNPLQEHAHLFANGKFKVSCKHHRAIMPLDFGQLLYIEQMPVSISDYTLIARPIEDMTDEEIWGWLDAWKDGAAEEYKDYHFDVNDVRNHIVDACERDTMSRDQFLYLLSIGVYPFDQQAFETGKVLNINEV